MSAPEFNTDLLDDLVLALLWFNSSEAKFGAHSAWKSLPWEALDRLHAGGLISEPRRKSYSVSLDDDAWERGRAAFEQWFGTTEPSAADSKPGKPSKPGKADDPVKPTADKIAGTVHQFKVVLDDIEPPVWRRIQLPGETTFWDLHCAINDAMGWEDAHLHEFQVGGKRNGVRIGIPLEDDMPVADDSGRADWEVPLSDCFSKPGVSCSYLYDFGDGWSHTVKLEATLPREPKARYPRCLDGARACPPEDCGGPPGYERLCAAIASPTATDEDTEELLEWLGDYDPDTFDPAKVKFRSAARRLKTLRSAQ